MTGELCGRVFVLDMKLLIVFALMAMLTVALADSGKDACWSGCQQTCAQLYCLADEGKRLADGPCDSQKAYGGFDCDLKKKEQSG